MLSTNLLMPGPAAGAAVCSAEQNADANGGLSIAPAPSASPSNGAQLCTDQNEPGCQADALSTALLQQPAGTISTVPIIQPIQPLADVATYLAHRVAVPHYTQEAALFATLPAIIKDSIRELLGPRPGGGIFGSITSALSEGLSVWAAVKEARCRFRVHLSIVRLRAKFDAWASTQDWASIVNRTRAGADWQDREGGVPEEFLFQVACRMARYARRDAKTEAIRSVYRQWRTGRNDDGDAEPIAGYGEHEMLIVHKGAKRILHGGYWQEWWRKNNPGRELPDHAPLPAGWDESNLARLIKAKNYFPKAVQRLIQEGTAAAREFLPDTLGTRAGLRKGMGNCQELSANPSGIGQKCPRSDARTPKPGGTRSVL